LHPLTDGQIRHHLRQALIVCQHLPHLQKSKLL